MTSPTQGWVVVTTSLWRIAEAVGNAAGGVWARNLLPAIQPAARRVASDAAGRITLEAARQPNTGLVRRRGVRMSMAASLESIRVFTAAKPMDLPQASATALEHGADLFAAVHGLSLPEELRRDLSLLSEGFARLARVPVLDPAAFVDVFTAREAVRLNPEDTTLKETMFDVESR